MTPRKELFSTIKKQLESISELEMIDIFRDQFSPNRAKLPEVNTAALIKFNSIKWKSGNAGLQEGSCDVIIMFCCKDGWRQQLNLDANKNELDILDSISEKLQLLEGRQFTPLQQTKDEALDFKETLNLQADNFMTYQLTFSTKIYQKLDSNYPYKKQKISIED